MSRLLPGCMIQVSVSGVISSGQRTHPKLQTLNPEPETLNPKGLRVLH